MDYFHYQNNQLHAEQVSLDAIAKQFGTPCYLYSKAMLEDNWLRFDKAFAGIKHRICYAVKANSNLAILHLFAKLQSGFDIVSLGELERVLAAGGQAQNIVFSGVGKKPHEILRALEVGIHCFNIESTAEIERINQLAKQVNKVAPVGLRINPNIDARTHPYIATGLNENKFGIAYTDAWDVIQYILSKPNLALTGVGCHIGSQITEISPFAEAVDRMLELVDRLMKESIPLQHLDIGGGLGVRYQHETPPPVEEYAAILCQKLKRYPFEIILEPGRSITANTGILLTSVEYIKETENKNFAIVDAAMNDLLRPALYDAWHRISPVTQQETTATKLYDIVGPVCESADFLGKDRELSLKPGDLLAIHSAGAYGFSMSSNYNSRPRAAEILVDKNQLHLIRERETIEELFAKEKL